MQQLIIDPEFQTLIPPLSKGELDLLETSIVDEGCRDPITTWDGIIIDGHNRYAICNKHNISFEIRPLFIQTRDEVVIWICMNQMGRRNINLETRKYLIGTRFEAEKRLGARNRAGTSQYSEVSPTMLGKPDLYETKYGLSERLGNEYNISHGTVEKYASYARAVDRIRKVDKAATSNILSGAIFLSHENLLDMARLNDQQLQTVTAKISDNQAFSLDKNALAQSIKMQQSKGTAPKQTPPQPSQSVKDMPPYDPDAEIASLALTVPSWCSSIKRAYGATNIQAVSRDAKTNLKRELESLVEIVGDILTTLQEASLYE